MAHGPSSLQKLWACFPCLQANLRPVCGKCTVPGCPCQQPAWSELVVNRQTQSITVKAKLLDADEPETLEVSYKVLHKLLGALAVTDAP